MQEEPISAKQKLEEERKVEIQKCQEEVLATLKKYSCSLSPVCVITSQGTKCEVQITG